MIKLYRLEAVIESEEVMKEGSLFNLTPTRGNIHCFKAITDTIIFDVLLPYYDHQTRFCNSYKEVGSLVQDSFSIEKKRKKGDKVSLYYLYDPPGIKVKIIPFPEMAGL